MPPHSLSSDLSRLETPPRWAEAPALTAGDLRARFDLTGSMTIGVEEELMLLDPETLLLAPEIERVLAAVDGDKRFTRELRCAQLEIVTAPFASVAECASQLVAARRALVERLRGEIRIAAAGTHPVSTDWGAISDAERYRTLSEEYTWAARRSLPCGFHVHVAVGGADRTLAVYNALRSYLPEIGALAANSPFFEGEETGLCSIRPKLVDALPRSGTPPRFRSWEELAELVAWGRRGGLFPDTTHFWWDLRLHPGYGTLELRVADAQTRPADAAAVAALFQCLAASLAERWDAGERLPVHRTHRIRENAWRALRYGVRGFFVDLDTGEAVPVRERIAGLLDGLLPVARRLGCDAELVAAGSLLVGNGADRQRYVAEREGLDGLLRWLVTETETSAFEREPAWVLG